MTLVNSINEFAHIVLVAKLFTKLAGTFNAPRSEMAESKTNVTITMFAFAKVPVEILVIRATLPAEDSCTSWVSWAESVAAKKMETVKLLVHVVW